LFCDDGNGEYVATIGSCNWLYTNFKPMEISVRLRSPKIVSDCLKVLEALIPKSNAGNYLREDLFTLGKRLNISSQCNTGAIQARIVTTGDHTEIVNNACDNAKDNIFVASNRAGNALENQVLAPIGNAVKKRKIESMVCYQRTNEKSLVTNEVMKALDDKYKEVKVQKVYSAHAKVLCWDSDDVVVTSLNWLSKDDYGGWYGEIGIYLNGTGLADYVKSCYINK